METNYSIKKWLSGFKSAVILLTFIGFSFTSIAQSVPSFSISEKWCTDKDITFTNSTLIASGDTLTYNWIISDVFLGFSSRKEPTYAWSTPGTYVVKLVIENQDGDTASVSHTISLGNTPELDFNLDNTCLNTPIAIAVTTDTTDLNLLWNIQDSTFEKNELNYTYTFDSLGKKSIDLKTTSSFGCEVSVKKQIDIKNHINLDFRVESECDEDSVFFINTSSEPSATYYWQLGDGKIDSAFSTSHEYAEEKVYTVTLSTSGYCEDSLTKEVSVGNYPDARFVLEREGRTVRVYGPEGMDIYQWSFGNGSRSSGQNAVHTYKNIEGDKIVCLVAKKGTCWSEECQELREKISVTDLHSTSIAIYPNPCQGKFTLRAREVSDAYITDMLGKRIAMSMIRRNAEEYDVVVSDLPSGIYSVHYTVGEDYFMSRLVVE